MKKIKTILLMLLVCVFSCITAYGEDDLWTEKEKANYESNIALLVKLGVIDEGKAIADTFTRAEYAKIMVSMLVDSGVFTNEQKKNSVYSFSDVDSNTRYASYIQAAHEMGIVNGYSDGTYRPTEMISSEQAIAGFINAMGYSFVAEEKGGYPNGYMKIAYDLDLLGGMDVRLGYDITSGELCKLIMNSLNVEFLYPYSNQITGLAENRFLNHLKIEKYSGIVKATEHGTIIGTTKTAENHININDELFYVEADCDDMLGYPVEFYVHSDDPEIIISINLDYGEYEELVLESSIIDSFRDNQYMYEKNNKLKKESFPYNTYIVYNGTAISNATSELMHPKNGNVKLLDNDDDGEYDVVFITDYALCVVNMVNESEYAIYDMFLASRSLKFKDETEYDIEDIYGEKLSISDLKKYNVLSIKQTQDKEYAKIIVSTENISGKITKVDEKYIYVDGVEYEIVGRDFYGTISLGASGIFLFDKENRIAAFINNTANQMRKGYLYWGRYTDEDLYPKLLLKIFTETGEVQKLSTTEKIVIDGVRKKADEALVLLKKGTDDVLPQIVLFSTNDEGLITKIDTPYNNAPADKNDIYNVQPGTAETKDSLRLILNMDNRKYWSSQLSFGGNRNISNSTVIFKIPSTSENLLEEDFAILSMSDFVGDRSYDIEMYSIGENRLTADIAVTTASSIMTSKYGVITDIKRGLNDDDEVVTIALFTTSNDVSIPIYIDDYTELSGALSSSGSIPEGSFVQLSLGSKNKAKTISVRYNSETGEMLNGTNPTGAMTQTHRIVVGNVYNREKDVIALTVKDVRNEVITDDDIETHMPSKFQCYEYDTTERRSTLRKISGDDIVDYMHGGSGYSKVLVYTYYGIEPRMMIVYK